jgi:hypothetical protein
MVVTSEKDLHGDLDPSARRMALEGMEARELYLARIELNLAALAEQIALLRTTLEERKKCCAGSLPASPTEPS